MATWDFGGGCPCGVSRVCDCGTYDKDNNAVIKLREPEVRYVWLVHPQSIEVTYATKDWEKVKVFSSAEKAMDYFIKHDYVKVKKIQLDKDLV